MTTTPSPASPSQAQQVALKPLVGAFFCLVLIVLGALDHFIAHDSWGAFGQGLIYVGVAGGFGMLGLAVPLPNFLK